ncbi:hypothetical protein SAMN03159294_1276 [Kosakonia radicincitans]|nr:hypothetical protein SAMN03159294_1276 [Kosakonia radicincitans]
MILLVSIKLMQVYKKNIDYLRTAIRLSDKNNRYKGDAVTNECNHYFTHLTVR